MSHFHADMTMTDDLLEERAKKRAVRTCLDCGAGIDARRKRCRPCSSAHVDTHQHQNTKRYLARKRAEGVR